MSEDRELRRKLWELAKEWDLIGMHCMDGVYVRCAHDLRQVLTYPATTDEDEAELVKTYGKTSTELADDAEKGYTP